MGQICTCACMIIVKHSINFYRAIILEPIINLFFCTVPVAHFMHDFFCVCLVVLIPLKVGRVMKLIYMKKSVMRR